MSGQDHRPLRDTPVTAQIARHSDNRLGAVYHALYGFWSARSAVFRNIGQRPDAYSVVLFDQSSHRVLSNDLDSSPEELLQIVLAYSTGWGTDFRIALNEARSLMESQWTPERSINTPFLLLRMHSYITIGLLWLFSCPMGKDGPKIWQ